jgi:NAD(P)-dependent dehydrogenase (short-subunit alcohol dehydrogenase family)
LASHQFRFENKLVMITGGANGIGAACAHRFASEGAKLAVIDRDKLGLDRSLAEIPVERIYSAAGDCTDQEALKEFYVGATQRFGPVDILINNVGQSGRERAGPFHLSNEDVWRFVLEVSLLCTMRLSRLVCSSMRERGGRIINISSDAALAGDEGLVDYAAAKMGVIGFTRALARELAPFRTTVNAVAPGAIRTKAHDQMPNETIERIIHTTPVGFVGMPDDVAAAVAFLASDEARYITGQTLLVDGGRWML